jgi:hypothetical protein
VRLPDRMMSANASASLRSTSIVPFGSSKNGTVHI